MGEQKKKKLNELMKLDIKDIKLNKKNTKKIKSSGSKKIIASFDINEDFIRIVEGSYYKEKLLINKWIESSTPPNTVQDGKIINEVLLVDELKKVLSENKIKAKYGSFTTNSTLIINREMIIPKIEEDEIDTVISFEISKYLPINLNDYIIQTLILEEIEVEGLEKLKVQTICYPEKIARGYHEVLENLNLKPYSLDVKFNSINKIVSYSQKINSIEYEIDASNIFVEIGPVSTDISIYNKGEIDFTRIIKLGYKNLHNYKLEDTENSGVNYLIEEVERIFSFYKNKVRGNKVDKVYLFGEGSRLQELDSYMSEKLQVQVETIDNVGFIEFSSKSNCDESSMYKYLNAIGTIIRL